MSDEATKKPDLKLVSEEELDEEELEFRSIRKDLPGVKGASAVGVVTIAVGKTPGKNEFFRTNKEFRPVVPMVDVEVGMEKHYFCLADNMIEPLASNKCYQVFRAPKDRFDEPIWPDLKPAKIFRLAFKDKGRLIDSPQHPLFLRWAARDKK